MTAGASDVFPTVILEAMACGKPVVSTGLAGIPEAVIDGINWAAGSHRGIRSSWRRRWRL